jgi:hypothetical protein
VEILTLAEARLRYAKGVRLTIAANRSAGVQALIARLQAGLGATCGQSHTIGLSSKLVQASGVSTAPPKTAPNATPFAGCPVYLNVSMAGQRCEVRLGDAWRLNPEPTILEWLRSSLEEIDLVVAYD